MTRNTTLRALSRPYSYNQQHHLYPLCPPPSPVTPEMIITKDWQTASRNSPSLLPHNHTRIVLRFRRNIVCLPRDVVRAPRQPDSLGRGRRNARRDDDVGDRADALCGHSGRRGEQEPEGEGERRQLSTSTQVYHRPYACLPANTDTISDSHVYRNLPGPQSHQPAVEVRMRNSQNPPLHRQRAFQFAVTPDTRLSLYISLHVLQEVARVKAGPTILSATRGSRCQWCII